MVLTEEQQRWCAEHTLGYGYDDDDPDKVQYVHLCEYVGGDGDAPRPVLAKHMTRKRLVRVRRATNAYARLLARGSGRTLYLPNQETGEVEAFKPNRETAHYWRSRESEEPQFETGLPDKSPLCDGCYAWIGSAGHSTVCGAYYRSLKYCRACCAAGVNDRDYERRVAAKARRKQPLVHERQRSVALCRSPRLWFGSAGLEWPAARDITCEDCLRILRERGCP